MGTRGYARKADSGCETIQCPRHPAVVMMPAGDDCGDSKHTGGVPGWKGTALKGRLAAAKERIVERTSGGTSIGRFLRVIAFIARSTTALSAYASPASNAVPT